MLTAPFARMQVFLNITVPPELASLADTPEGLLPALPNPLVNFVQQYLNNALGEGEFSFGVPATTSANLFNLDALLSGILPQGIQNTSFGNELVTFVNNTVGAPVGTHMGPALKGGVMVLALTCWGGCALAFEGCRRLRR